MLIKKESCAPKHRTLFSIILHHNTSILIRMNRYYLHQIDESHHNRYHSPEKCQINHSQNISFGIEAMPSKPSGQYGQPDILFLFYQLLFPFRESLSESPEKAPDAVSLRFHTSLFHCIPQCEICLRYIVYCLILTNCLFFFIFFFTQTALSPVFIHFYMPQLKSCGIRVFMYYNICKLLLLQRF